MPSRRSSKPEQLGLPLAGALDPAARSQRLARGRPRLAQPSAEQGLVAGVDEAGRGPLAGPVVAAAVILDPARPIPGLADSKTLSEAARERLDAAVRERALALCVAEGDVEEIGRLNILGATMLAMQRAVQGLRLVPIRVLVDGNRLPELNIPAQAVVRGDSRVAAIAAASILAKVHRDRLCRRLEVDFPGYGFAVHKGYPTAAHLQALRRLGPCPAHRSGFAPVDAARAAAGVPADLNMAQLRP